MKKILVSLVTCHLSLFALCANAAITITKSAPVATQKNSAGSSLTGSSSMLPGIISLASGVIAANQQAKQLTANCRPTSAEITFVSNMVREWARVGSSNAESAMAALNSDACTANSYAYEMRTNYGIRGAQICTDTFDMREDDGAIWRGYPKPSIAEFCKDGASTCRDKIVVSNVYDIFALVDFEPDDYLPSEANTANKLIMRMEECSNVKLNAKKRDLWMNFMGSAVSGLGQNDTANLMQNVQSIVGSGGGALGALGGIGTALSGQLMQY